MKIYVAGKFTDPEKARSVMEQLRAVGHTITYDWTKCNKGQDPEYLKICADADLNGVRQADAVVALFLDPEYAYRGTFTEVGYALGREIRVIAVSQGPGAYSENCFFHASGITHCNSIDQAMQQLI